MKPHEIHAAIAMLREMYTSWQTPAVTVVAQCGRSPFKVLVSCIISLRTKDEVTALASARLFEQGDSPDSVVRLSLIHI